MTVTQTFVDNIKGTDKWNDEAKNDAKQKAIDIAKELISEDAKIAINEIFGDFQTYLVTTIEQAVKNKIYLLLRECEISHSLFYLKWRYNYDFKLWS